MSVEHSRNDLGWKPFFQQQLTLEEWEEAAPARVIQQHRANLELFTESGKVILKLLPKMPQFTVGDWLLLNHDGAFIRLLDRFSLFSRRAAGTKVAEQLIAANLDTIFIVLSLNEDFNLNRIERYLSLAHEAQVEPVVVLTKADLCPETDAYKNQVQNLDSMLLVEVLNALDADSVATLLPWCDKGQTVAFMGSSGVGKSTLINSLLGDNVQLTSGIREDDSKGRHTTTGRSLHIMPNGGLLIDTPGMRELQLTDCNDGLRNTFADIAELAESCRFADCAHENEPGCAVKRAVADGALEERRFNNYKKLLREQALNASTLAERRARDKSFAKFCRSAQTQARHIKGD